jgi:hypothetical protein
MYLQCSLLQQKAAPMTTLMHEYWTRKQLAEELSPRGKPLDPRTVRKLEEEGLPFIELAGHKLYPIRGAREFLRQREKSAAA